MPKKTTLSKLKEQENKKRKKVIVDAAREIFRTMDFDEVSMRVIAQDIGVAPSSIYTYFESRKALCEEIVYQDSSGFISSLKKKVREVSCPDLKLIIDHFIDYFTAHEHQLRMISYVGLDGWDEKFHASIKKIMDIIESTLKGQGHTGDTRATAREVFLFLSGILMAAPKYPWKDPADRLAHLRQMGRMIESMTDQVRSQADEAADTSSAGGQGAKKTA